MAGIKNWFEKNKKTAFLLAAIFIVGVFLRTYEFHDWLRFSKDQSRDAWVISRAMQEGNHIPYLGPNAGTTKFRLGPAYYYFSYATEKIFGNYPDKMAYPSVFFSILSIPFLFFFLKEFFSQKISLAATAIASVSYFLVINSRFSSNPNLITFFVLLYLFSLLKILNNQEKKFYPHTHNISNICAEENESKNAKCNIFRYYQHKSVGVGVYIWSALVGISMGVGIQLHTTLLFVMPVMTFLVFAWLLFKDKSAAKIWKKAVVIFLFLLIPNISQIYSEIDSHGNNTKLFFKGFMKSSEGESNFLKSTFLIASCQIQANTHIVSSFQDDINCANVFRMPKGNMADNVIYYVGIAITIIFSLAGYFLLWKRFREEEDAKKKNFLGLVMIFNLISFAILIPIAGIIFVGYFINLFFIPLIMLGLFIEFFQNKLEKTGKIIIILGVAFLVSSSLIRNGMAAGRYMKGLENNDKNSTLGEIEKMRDYIFSTSGNYPRIYFEGKGNALTSRFYAPLEYFSKEADIKMERISLKSSGSDPKTDKNAPIYYIEENGLDNTAPGQMIDGHEVIGSKSFSQQTILMLKH